MSISYLPEVSYTSNTDCKYGMSILIKLTSLKSFSIIALNLRIWTTFLSQYIMSTLHIQLLYTSPNFFPITSVYPFQPTHFSTIYTLPIGVLFIVDTLPHYAFSTNLVSLSSFTLHPVPTSSIFFNICLSFKTENNR